MPSARPWAILLISSACAGSSPAPRPAPAGPPAPHPLAELRAQFAARKADAAGSPAVKEASARATELAASLAPADAAEAQLIVTLWTATALERSWEPLAAGRADGEAELAELLPVVFPARSEDGESTDAYFDRLCQSHGGGGCAEVLPEHWPAVLGSLAARRLGERGAELVRTCACAARYQADLSAASAFADKAAAWVAESAPAWTLAVDRLPSSSMAPTELAPGDARVPVLWSAGHFVLDAAGAAPTPAAELAAVAFAAAGKPAPNGLRLLELRADRDLPVRELYALGRTAAAAGFDGLLLVARHAAPPYARCYLRMSFSPARPRTALAGQLPGKVASLQKLVDAADGLLARGASELRLPVR